MGTGIGENCKVCGEQLNYDDGFDSEKKICNSCKEMIPKVLTYISQEAHNERGKG